MPYTAYSKTNKSSFTKHFITVQIKCYGVIGLSNRSSGNQPNLIIKFQHSTKFVILKTVISLDMKISLTLIQTVHKTNRRSGVVLLTASCIMPISYGSYDGGVAQW